MRIVLNVMLPHEPGIIGQICVVFRKRMDSFDAFLHAGVVTMLVALNGKKVSGRLR